MRKVILAALAAIVLAGYASIAAPHAARASPPAPSINVTAEAETLAASLMCSQLSPRANTIKQDSTAATPVSFPAMISLNASLWEKQLGAIARESEAPGIPLGPVRPRELGIAISKVAVDMAVAKCDQDSGRCGASGRYWAKAVLGLNTARRMCPLPSG